MHFRGGKDTVTERETEHFGVRTSVASVEGGLAQRPGCVH